MSRPGSEGYALFRMVYDPEEDQTDRAVLGVHEHPPGIEPIPPHYHENVEETVYIVSGEGVVALGYDPDEMNAHAFGPGSSWYVPPNCYHCIENTGKQMIKMVVSYFGKGGAISHRLVSHEWMVVAPQE